MKSNKIFKTGFLVIALLGLGFMSCNKDIVNPELSDSASLKQLTADEIQMEDASDNSLKDVESVLSNGTGGNKALAYQLCNVIVDSSAVVNDTISIYLTYNGLNCNGTRFRTGSVTIRRPANVFWGNAGASVELSFNNLSITRVATGHTLILNGNKTYENVSGGHLWQMGTTLSTIVHRVTGSLQATFNDSTTRTWNIARQITYSGSFGDLLRTTDGFGSAGGYSNLVVWGVNRQGEDFYTNISQSVVHKESCDWDPVAGIKVHQIPSLSKSCTITFGYDSNYQPVTNGDCPSYYRLDWVNNGNSGTLYHLLW
jgi:hypothetical protein